MKLLLMSVLNMLLLFLPLSVSAQEQNIGPVTLNATFAKDPTVTSSSPSMLNYKVNLPATFHFINRPDLNYTLTEPDELRLYIDDGDLSLSGDFRIEKENATSVSTEFMEISGTARIDSQIYDKRSGITP